MGHELYSEGQQVRLIAYFLRPHTEGSILAGEVALTVVDPTGLLSSDPVFLEGAGPVGSDLVTTIASIAGNVVTLATAAGTSVELARFGKRVNPTTLEFKVKRPPRAGGSTDTYTQASPEVTNPLVGRWELLYSPASHGTYKWAGKGTGTAAGRDVDSFTVERDEIL